MRSERGLWMVALLFAGLMSNASVALAAQDIFSCDSTQPGNTTVCTSNCILKTDIVCAHGNPNHQGITLTNGADLNMDGWDITFTGTPSGTLPAKVAVTAGSNSIVKNTSNNESVISGPFSQLFGGGVKCVTATGTKVSGIRVSVSSGYGIMDCRTVEDSVVESSSTVSGVGIKDVQTVTNNSVTGFLTGIGGAYAVIDRNLVTTTAAGNKGISGGTGSSVTGNVILGPGDLITAPGSISVADNYCDVNSTNCASCVSAGYCVSPRAPFSW